MIDKILNFKFENKHKIINELNYIILSVYNYINIY